MENDAYLKYTGYRAGRLFSDPKLYLGPHTAMGCMLLGFPCLLLMRRLVPDLFPDIVALSPYFFSLSAIFAAHVLPVRSGSPNRQTGLPVNEICVAVIYFSVLCCGLPAWLMLSNDEAPVEACDEEASVAEQERLLHGQMSGHVLVTYAVVKLKKARKKVTCAALRKKVTQYKATKNGTLFHKHASKLLKFSWTLSLVMMLLAPIANFFALTSNLLSAYKSGWPTIGVDDTNLPLPASGVDPYSGNTGWLGYIWSFAIFGWSIFFLVNSTVKHVYPSFKWSDYSKARVPLAVLQHADISVELNFVQGAVLTFFVLYAGGRVRPVHHAVRHALHLVQ